MQHLSAKDFFKPTPFNSDTKNQIWMSQISDSHDNFCNCNCPFSHLLASIFPPGHKDRLLSIQQILTRDYKELCRSGGAGETGGGEADTEPTEDADHIKQEEEENEYIKDEDLDELIKLGEDAETR